MENFEDIRNKYLELVDFLVKYFPDKNKDLAKELLTDEIIKQQVVLFVNSVNAKSKYQNMLVDRNVNMFHKTGHLNYIPFFPTVNIKKFLLGDDKYVQHIIWESLQIIYLLAENGKNEKWHELLLFKIENTECPPVSALPDDKKQEALNNMVSDITDIFKNIGEQGNGNMMDNLMKTASGIAEKYNGDLSSQDLDINKIIKAVSKAFGQDENEMSSLITENPMIQSLLKGGSVEDMMKGMKDMIGMDPTEMLKNPEMGKIMGQALGGLGGDVGGLGGSSNMVGSLLSGAMGMLSGKEETKNTTDLTEEQMRELEEFFKNNGDAFEKFLTNNDVKKNE
jgi:hypothetical protein